MSCHHKDDESIDVFKKYFTPINVGANTNHIKKEILKDNSLNNISDKNPHFCELTALYWAWKNNSDDYVGLMHYRRIFLKSEDLLLSNNLKKLRLFLRKKLNKHSINHYYSKIIDESKIEKELKDLNYFFDNELINYDIVMAAPLYLDGLSIEEQFLSVHSQRFFTKMIKVIEELYPDMKESMLKTLKRKDMSAFNMLVMKRDIYEKYMEVLFSVMFKIEQDINLDQEDSYQQRMTGFLAERFFNIYTDYFFSINPDSKRKYLELALIK